MFLIVTKITIEKQIFFLKILIYKKKPICLVHKKLIRLMCRLEKSTILNLNVKFSKFTIIYVHPQYKLLT